MLDQVNTAIGFTVVMLLLSLLITTAVQIVVAVLDLRGQKLQEGLVNLLKQVAPELRQASKRKPRGLLARNLTLADEVADAVVTHPALSSGIRRLKAIRLEELTKLLNDLASNDTLHLGAISIEARDALNVALSQAQTLEQKAAAWFDAVMDRTSDAFQLYSRGITIVVSAVLVLALQIDAISIFKQVSTNPDLRASLVQMSEGTTALAERVLADAPPANKTLAEMKAAHADIAFLQSVPAMLVRCSEGETWFKEHATDDPDGKLAKEFNTTCQQKVDSALKAANENFTKIRTSLAASQLQIVGFGDKGFWASLESYSRWIGMLLAGVFLSLGAPFWFNTLKQLSALKPMVAKKIEQESAGA